ncbi:MAG: type IV pilus secretin PilQ [Bdellovibrionaceae bacterium]|nr:type IV pilus secretin PilQ [Pseudobdellovibrionaceae bacterium]
MTRMFFHLVIAFAFISLTSCSIFSSDDDVVAASSMEGASANIEVESDEGDSTSDLEDLDLESADSNDSNNTDSDLQANAGDSTDSFGDIEDFNEGMLESELSGEDLGTGNKKALSEKNSDVGSADADLDLETADLAPPSGTENSSDNLQSDEQMTAVTKSSANNKITNLEYRSEESGGSVVISANGPFTYDVREEPQFNQTIIEVSDVQLPDRFKLPYIAKDFDQSVATVNAYQDSGSTTARFVIQYKSSLKPAIQMKGNELFVMNSGVTSEAPVVASHANPSSKKITLEMQDTEIKDLVYFIADQVGANVIVDDDVSGKANVKLQDVQWEEALSSILKAHGLTYERKGQVLRVAKISTITRELNEETGRMQAELAAETAGAPRLVKVIPVSYANLDTLALQVKPFLSTIGTALVDKQSSSVIVSDYAIPVSRVEQLIKSLDVQPIQLLIEGKIIEASDNFSREFGIQWGSTGGTFDVGAQTATLTQTIRADKAPASLAGGYLGNITVGTFDVLGDLNALLAVYEREEKIKILSSPKVTTLNKEKAHIEAVQQVPNVSTQQTANVGATTSVSFQNAMLSLEVTPQVTFNSDVIMQVIVKRDVPGAPVGTQGTRAINKRLAETKVIVKDGNSLVIGGIFSQDETYAEGGVPILKDIPILGYLFKTKRKEINKNELVIFLTPKILNPENILKGTEITGSMASAASATKDSFEEEKNTEKKSKTDDFDKASGEIMDEVETL